MPPLFTRSIKQKLLTGGAWALAGKIATTLTGLAVNALLARLLTPEEMGVYFLLLSLVSVAAIIAQVGLTQTIVRLVAESIGTGRPGRARYSIILVLRMVAISGLVVACLFIFGLGKWIAERLFNSGLMAQVMGLAAMWAVIITFQQLLAEIYRGFHDVRLATLFGGLITSILSMVLFGALWMTQGHGDINQILILTVGAGLSSVLISSGFLWNRLSQMPTTEDVSLIDVLYISWPLWITNITLFILVQADIWVMGLFRSPEEVAIYGAAVKIVTLVTMPLLVVNSVVPPIISEMFAQRKIQDLEKTLRLVATLAGIPSLVVLSIFVVFSGDVLALLFGDYYQQGGIIVAILSVGQLVNVWSGSCGQVLMLTGHQRTMMSVTLVCGVLVVLSAWLLVLTYGGVGVAIAAGSGMVLQNFLMLFFAKKKTGVWTHANLQLLKNVRKLL